MNQTAAAEVVVGVDTHKHIHVAAAVSPLGMRLDGITGGLASSRIGGRPAE